MESHIKSVLNFETDGIAEHISSPRSLEACLRSGCDPQELMPRQVTLCEEIYTAQVCYCGHAQGVLPSTYQLRRRVTPLFVECIFRSFDSLAGVRNRCFDF